MTEQVEKNILLDYNSSYNQLKLQNSLWNIIGSSGNFENVVKNISSMFLEILSKTSDHLTVHSFYPV